MDKAIEVSNVEMHFNMSKFKIDSIKEYIIKYQRYSLTFMYKQKNMILQ